ncbi:ubiquinone biosynthesis regulatory protein kinase UbiB [Flocculibacter collagenilyticus]|uniref:ubiquinone biosynthesis regulatory protein kinase UbiB n=1 Tax=Flocculibacter collagenilyticus TaxID=2744479 RepID=UPI0018F5F5E6
MRITRLIKITKTFFQYGLDELIPPMWLPWYVTPLRTMIFWWRNKHPDKTRGQRIRLALQELGPVWVKFGQMLSTRRDLLPHDIANELNFLQDKVAPFDGKQAQQLIEHALEINDISQRFVEFDIKPLASASIAQVHTAHLIDHDGEHKDVVIKVIRPGIDRIINADVELMQVIAGFVARYMPDGKRLRPREVIEEYKKTIIDELDLLREAANAIQLRRNFENSDSLYVPFVYSDFCRHNVLVMERIYGIPVSDIAALKANNTNLEKLAERGVEVFFTQVFRDSFFHADMHPGNVFVSYENPQSPQYIGIDCGIVGTLNREDKRYLAENFIAFFNRDYRKVAELHVDSGWVPADTNLEDFEFAIRTVCEPIFNKPLAEISFGHVLVNLFNTARRFNMEVQPQLVLLQKTLLYIEGLGRQLYPQLDLWKTAKPFLENWMKEQIGPKAVYNNVKANLPFWGEKLPEIPDLIYDYLKAGKYAHQMQQLHMIKNQQETNRQHKLTRITILLGCAIIALAITFK